MSQFALPNNYFGLLFAPFYQCIAISQTPDPTGAYYRYQYQFSKLNDYPKFGVWPDGYYMAINQFTPVQPAVLPDRASRRSTARRCSPASRAAWSTSTSSRRSESRWHAAVRSRRTGAARPVHPTCTRRWMTTRRAIRTDRLQLWRFRADWTRRPNPRSPGHRTSTSRRSTRTCAGTRVRASRKPARRARLDALPDRLMYRLQYRNFGTHDSLVVNHTVDVDGTDHAGVRWYEIRNPATAPVVHQQGTFAPDALHRWMASAAMDSARQHGDRLQHRRRGTLSPSIRYTGAARDRSPGVDGAGEERSDPGIRVADPHA